MKRAVLLPVLAWSVVVAASLVWNIQREKSQILIRATTEAHANHNKDISFRRWASGHGGVYVPITATQKSIPWLAHIKDRDVVTTDGRQLTLLNPASMLRQTMDRYSADYGIRGRITGLKYLNPGNAPDAWERARMLEFQNGLVKESTQVADLGGQPHLRYLRAMYMENQACIRCHAVLGFTRLGEFRGAIGVNVPLAPYLAAYAQARTALLLSHGGFWALGLFGIVFTARRQARLMARLVESETRWQFALEGSGLAVWDWDARSDKIYFSPRWKAMLGYAEDEIGDDISEWDKRVHPDDQVGCYADVGRFLRGEAATYVNEHRLRRKDGVWLRVRARGNVIERDADGRPLRVIGTHLDVTARRAAEAERAQLQQQLQHAQKLEAVGQLTGGIAHDFNNILGAILGYTSLTLDRYRAELPEKAVGYLEEVEKAGERARDLIQKMLAFARGGSGEAQRIDARPLVSEVIKMLASTLPSSLELREQIADSVPPIRIDPVQLHQILTNLIINARDATGGEGHIEVGLRASALAGEVCDICHQPVRGAFVELYVTDDGSGIPVEALPKIFDPFFTTKEVGKGSGMGLAMVMGILREHDGHVRVETTAGAGTTFRLYFQPADASVKSP